MTLNKAREYKLTDRYVTKFEVQHSFCSSHDGTIGY